MDNLLIRHGVPYFEIDWDTWYIFIYKLIQRFNLTETRIYGGFLCEDGTVVEDNEGVSIIENVYDRKNIDDYLGCQHVTHVLHIDCDIPGSTNMIGLTLLKHEMYFLSVRFITKDRSATWDLYKEILETIQD